MDKVFLFANLILFIKLINGFENRDGEIFDFIIVGGGTAGCVIAGRLAESGKHKVLLIEEGGIPNPGLSIPATGVWLFHPNETKYYYSVPQQNAGLINGGVVRIGIGKTMGGGSSVNGMFWNRGHPGAYDSWARSSKDESWSYANMLKCFTKIEDYSGFNPTEQRGYNGPVSIKHAVYAPAMREFIEASHELGYPLGDANGPQSPSVTKVDFNYDQRRRRVSSYSGYIQPLLNVGRRYAAEGKESNLKILLHTEAKRLIFDGNRVTGVTFVDNSAGVTGYAKARKEVIISAGALDSPALLMRSGIGPKDDLERANVHVIKNLPGVGKNLQDHYLLRVPITFGNRSAAVVPSRDLTPQAWELFEQTATGPWSSFWGTGAQAFFHSSLQNPLQRDSDWADIHYIPLGWEENSTQVVDLKEWEVIVHWLPILVRPKSRGTVSLNPENVDGPPLIDFQYLNHPDDLQVMIDGMKFTEKLCEGTFAMQTLGCRLPSTPIPECSHLKFKSNSYWACYSKQLGQSAFHAAGTCKMGSGPEDAHAVVDSKLRVIGIEGLRVADTSIMPVITNGNTQAVAFVIGEKAADMILQNYHLEKINSFNLNSTNTLLSLIKFQKNQ